MINRMQPEPLETAQRERWQKISAKGKTRYILKWGVLCWGLPMFVVMTTLDLYQQRIPSGIGIIGYATHISLNVVLWLAAGYTFGLLQWRRYEKRFGSTRVERGSH